MLLIAGVYGSWLTADSQPESLVMEWLGQNENSKQAKFHLDNGI